MAGENTYSTISGFVNTIWQGAQLVASEQGAMTRLVTVFNDKVGRATRQNSVYSGGTVVYPSAETTDLSSQALTPASVATLTPYRAAAQYFETDARIESDPFQTIRDASNDMGGKIGTRVDTLLANSFSSFTGATLGTAGATVTWAKIANAVSLLRAGHVPLPYVCVMHPYMWNVLAATLPKSSANAPVFEDSIMANFWIDRVYGVDFFIDGNVTVDGSGDSYFGMFNRDALALDVRQAFKIAPQRDESRFGLELNASMVFGYGVWRPAYGVCGIYDSPTPS